MRTITIDTAVHYLARVSDLTPGSVLASGHVVESVATGGRRYGSSVQVSFTNGSKGNAGRDNRIWVRSIA